MSGNSYQRAICLTQELVRFQSVNSTNPERPCAEYLARTLAQGGFSIDLHEFAPNRTSVVARIGGHPDRRPLVFVGHTDTVPLGARPWSHHPFAGEVSDGKLYGRGSSDMKSGVAAFVVAALELAPHAAGTAGLTLLIVAGEETGCEGSFHLARHADIGTAGAMVIAEPSSNYPLVAHKGALWLRARTRGVTAHGSMPEKGRNAIYGAARAVGTLERFRFDAAPDPLLGQPTLNVGTIRGGLNLNSVPDHVEIGIDIRTIPGQRHSEVRNALQVALGSEVELEPVVDVPSIRTPVENPWVQQVFELMTPILGERPKAKAATYFTDGSALTPAFGGVATIVLGPGEASVAHQTDEWCEVDRIGQAVEAYLEIARRWCRL
jgi:succinyl-diaminopimelate desuccinylase